ncbi:MAG: hypothetical protein ACRD08_12615, partial [Acidimicrobiales bacterium]
MSPVQRLASYRRLRLPTAASPDGRVAWLVVALVGLGGAQPASAQVVRAFASRFTTNANGKRADESGTPCIAGRRAHCTDAQAGTGGSLNNNTFDMMRVDADGGLHAAGGRGPAQRPTRSRMSRSSSSANGLARTGRRERCS